MSNDKRPTHNLWQVIGEGDNAYWLKIGAAWTNRDGKGYSIRLDALPLTGRTVMREVPEDEAGKEEGGR